MSVLEVCSKLRKPGLQLSELCTLINTLGDCLTLEIMDGNQNIAQIKSGWEQLIEILIQTNHPTVRHIAFQNVKYILNGRNGISENKPVLSEIGSGVIKLLYHWNENIQLEILDAILQDEYPIRKDKIPLGQPSILSSLINSDIEILNYLLSLMVQYNNCQFYLVVMKMLSSFKFAIKDIHSKEAVKSIVDQLCQLEKNLSLDEISREIAATGENLQYIKTSCDYSKQEFLVIIFEIFNNIPNKFQDIKVVCYNMIKDELSLLLSEKLLGTINYFPYYNLIENGFKAMTKTSLYHPLVSLDHMKWMRGVWNLISSKIFSNNLNKYLNEENESILFKILNQAMKSILTIYLEKGQVLFIWGFELKENNNNDIEVDNNIIKDETIFIFNLDQIVQEFINFIVNLPKECFCSNDGVCEYISILSAMINIGLELDEGKTSGTNKLHNERFFINLVLSVTHFLEEVKDLKTFQPFQGENTKLLESYFLLNFILCKSHYLIALVRNDHQLEIKDQNLIGELSSNFLEWVICQSNSQLDEFMKILSEQTLKTLYFGLAPRWITQHNKYRRIGLSSSNNPEIMFLTILRNLYKYAFLDGQNDLPLNCNLNHEEITKLLSNFYFCCLYFHRLDLKSRKEAFKSKIQLQEHTEETILSFLPCLYVTNIYKYAKYFAVIGRYKISKAMFESIKLYTLESRVWINILVYIIQFYDCITSFLRTNEALEDHNNSSLSFQKNLVIKLRSTLKNIESNFKFINNSNICFFSSIYFLGILKINEFLSKSFNSRFNKETDDHQIDHFETLCHLVDILKTLFGLANITKAISTHTFQIIIQIYWSLKQIALKIIISHMKYTIEHFLETKDESNNQRVVNKSSDLLKKTLLFALDQKIPKFNILIEKSFIDNALTLFKILDFNTFFQLEWQLVQKKVSSDNLANIFLLNLRKHPNDILTSLFKNPRKPGEKSSFSLIYLRNSSFSHSNSSSSAESYSKFSENTSADLQSRLWRNVSSDTLVHECMHLLASVGRLPPILLIQKMLPHIYLRGEILGFQNNRDCADSLGISSDTVSVANGHQVVPVLKLYGFFKSGFQKNLPQECFWARIKLSYLFKEGEELLASHLLDLSITEAHFSWVQPIERIPNAQSLKIVSVPLNQYKICIGVPYVLFINIL
ncbi:uncharacterized protein ELE39_002218 [Cryptosporidium sp. chipmunk genotype I]|uniref:uncharacterized protein n=1 Tax=Cryptosporidium sp. chipmunk genotype I TaxID=1280935 RepID=UPI003519F59C|nr:hypothetical protein ELE39_002218 [Cryptosporidium sp. chipmunk genotype I]